MELFFEPRPNMEAFLGTTRFIQVPPEIHPEPVLRPDTEHDGSGVSIYGSVINEGGMLRMWYQAWPRNWNYQQDVASVAYAESEDGVEWRKPTITGFPNGERRGNLCNFNLHSPSVFIDPTAPPGSRYRGVGYGNTGDHFALSGAASLQAGYYTTSSGDGFCWQRDRDQPEWNSGDVITGIYHPGRKKGMIAMKYSSRLKQADRRCIHTATYADGVYSPAVSALYPDEYDDVLAAANGYVSADYYGMGMLPVGMGTLGFLWRFNHEFPYVGKHRYGFYGPVDVRLAYQMEEGGRWLHAPGRQSLFDRTAQPWMAGSLYTSSAPVEVKDEHCLYFTAGPLEHGFYLDGNLKRDAHWADYAKSNGVYTIGVAKWPRFRFVGIETIREGSFVVNLGVREKPVELFLNFETKPEGFIRVETVEPNGGCRQSIPLCGNGLRQKVEWSKPGLLKSTSGQPLKLRIVMKLATAYAYDVEE